jgi:hypothetical protein
LISGAAAEARSLQKKSDRSMTMHSNIRRETPEPGAKDSVDRVNDELSRASWEVDFLSRASVTDQWLTAIFTNRSPGQA